MITFKPPKKAMRADVFERHGNRFVSDIQIIETPGDVASAEWTQHILDKYADKVVAYYVTPAFGSDTFSIELQFADTEDGRATAMECRKEYRSGYQKGGCVVQKKKSANAKNSKGKRKRLYKKRMYRLPDGQLFWYFGLWDRHGNLIGKVEVMDRPHQHGTMSIENSIIHRSVLEEAELIPKGEEPWVME